MRYAALAAYVGTVFLANWLLETFGGIPIGFGLMAPAGVLTAGLAFSFRDLVHELLGRWWVLSGIVLGALASACVSPEFAIASGLAFFASEMADMLVYSPLRRRNWIAAIAASNTVGLVADSLLFLWLAFGSLDFLAGQVVGKTYMTLLFVIPLMIWRRHDLLSWSAPTPLVARD